MVQRTKLRARFDEERADLLEQIKSLTLSKDALEAQVRAFQSNHQPLDSELKEVPQVQQDQLEVQEEALQNQEDSSSSQLTKKLEAKGQECEELRRQLQNQNVTIQIIMTSYQNSFSEAEDRHAKAEAQWKQRLLELEQKLEEQKEKLSLSEEENQGMQEKYNALLQDWTSKEEKWTQTPNEMEEENQETQVEQQTTLRSWGSMMELSEECNEKEEDQEIQEEDLPALQSDTPPPPIVSQPDPCRASTVPSPLGTGEPALVDLPLPPLVPLPTVSSPATGMNERMTDSAAHLPVLGSGPVNTSTPSPDISQSQHQISSDRGQTTNHPEESHPKPTTPQVPTFGLSEDILTEFLSKEDPPVFYTKLHFRSQNKLEEWDLKVKKGTLIIGDANLARFPFFYDPHIQVDSYSGATFRHAQTLLDKCTVHSKKVETIILSFGINCRTKRLEATLQELEATVRAAQRRFPKAVIKIPLINFSEDLPTPQKQILRRINTYLTDMPIDTIPLLEDFSTCPDQIHWNAQTAKKMWAHWMTALNN